MSRRKQSRRSELAEIARLNRETGAIKAEIERRRASLMTPDEVRAWLREEIPLRRAELLALAPEGVDLARDPLLAEFFGDMDALVEKWLERILNRQTGAQQ